MARANRPQFPLAPQPAPQPWLRRNLGTLGVTGAFIVAIVALILFAQAQNRASSVGVGNPVPADVLSAVTSVSPAVATKVGSGGLQSTMEATPKHTPALMADGKPEVIYVGGDYCPYCAASRWSTVVALSRFGAFKGLILMKSSGSDVYPNTATFSFEKATYISQYITFTSVETATRDGSPLMKPSGHSATALATYDVPPYTPQANGIPFYDFGDQYVSTSALYTPTMLQGLTWQQIASHLSDPNSDVAKAIVGGANEQTAAICKLTNDQPATVCSQPAIQAIEAALPQPK